MFQTFCKNFVGCIGQVHFVLLLFYYLRLNRLPYSFTGLIFIAQKDDT